MKHPGQHKQTSHNAFPHPLTQSRHQYQAGHTPSCLPLPSPCTFSSLARAHHSSLDPQIRSSSTSLCSWSTSTYPFAIETDAFGLFCIQFFAQCSCSLLDSLLFCSLQSQTYKCLPFLTDFIILGHHNPVHELWQWENETMFLVTPVQLMQETESSEVSLLGANPLGFSHLKTGGSKKEMQ